MPKQIPVRCYNELDAKEVVFCPFLLNKNQEGLDSIDKQQLSTGG